MLDAEDVDLEDVAGGGGVDGDRAGEGVDEGAVDGLEVCERRGGGDLCAAGVEAGEVDGVAGVDGEARWQGGVPAGVCGLSGERVFGHELDLHRHLEFNESVAGEAADANGGADVAAGFAEEREEEVAGAVDNLGRVGEAGDGVDVAVDGEDAADLVERAEVLLQDGELEEGAAAGGCVGFVNGFVETHGAGEDAVPGGLRDDTAEVDDAAGGFGRGVVAAGCGRGWQLEAEGGEGGVDVHDEGYCSMQIFCGLRRVFG